MRGQYGEAEGAQERGEPGVAAPGKRGGHGGEGGADFRQSPAGAVSDSEVCGQGRERGRPVSGGVYWTD